jgi:DNA repair protein RadA/Sms
VEEVAQAAPRSGRAALATSGGTRAQAPVTLSQVQGSHEARRSTGIFELDRVLGGGLVRGSLILVGGDPGIGKSTLLLQAFGALAAQGEAALYVTGEESLHQVKLRAERLGVTSENLYILAETEFEAIEAAQTDLKPTAVVIDSIQTVGLAEMDSAVGSVSQIRAVTARLMAFAKGRGVATFVVGHVTKEGTIAGPKVMEHMVDTVLYFEGDRTGPYRILRAHKNRFGSAQEIGVFEMDEAGLKAVANPSELFLSQRAEGPGATVITSLEGSRPILLEVQALVTPAFYGGTPRRTTTGCEPQRVAMLCAVLGARAGIDLAGSDVFVNVAGGVRISEPAADLGVVLALASAANNVPIPRDWVAVGEVGLSGEVRAAAQLKARLAEAAALGFRRALIPEVDERRLPGKPPLPVVGVATVQAALQLCNLLPEGRDAAATSRRRS